MATARVNSLEALSAAKVAISLFIEEASSAMSEADADLARTAEWLRMDRIPYWQKQIRVRSEALAAARSDLLRKQMSSHADNPTAIMERRAIEKAKLGIDEATEKLNRTRKWLAMWEREAALYKGQCQALADTVARDMPAAITRIERMARSLQEYLALQASAPAGAAGSAAGGVAGMARGSTPSQTPEAPAGPEEIDPLEAVRRLRRRSASPAQRAELRVGTLEMAVLPSRPRVIVPADLATLGRLGLVGEAPEPFAKVVIEMAALTESSYFLEREETPEAGDSGWYIGATLAAAHETVAVSVSDLVAAVPDLAPVLALAGGCLLVVSGDHVEALLNAADQDMWGAGELREDSEG